jgi:cytochrome c
MNLRPLAVATLVALLGAPLACTAAGKATAGEATAMVRKGVDFIRAHGPDKGYAEISSKSSRFKDRDLYLVVYGLDGSVHAHGANARMIGKNLIALKDGDGKAFVRERVELARTRGSFWHDYKFTNPVSRQVEPKTMYCERLDATVVCGGIYK